MPAYSSDTKKYHRERVRSIMVQNPMLAGEHIRQKLERQGLVLDRNYINGIVNDIHRERARRAETWTLNHALASLQDSMAEIVRVAWEIVNDPNARNMDKTLAMREIREAHNLVFEKLFDAGVFERKLGTLDAVIRNTPLPEERKQAIRATFTNWGLLAAATNSEPISNSLVVPKEDEKPNEPVQ